MRTRIAALSALLSITPGADLCGQTASQVEIVAFRPESRLLAIGDTARSQLVIRNLTAERRTFWIGYSVRDSVDLWYDVPAESVTLSPGEARSPGPFLPVRLVARTGS